MMDLSTDEVDRLCWCWCFDGEALGCVVVSILKDSISHVY